MGFDERTVLGLHPSKATTATPEGCPCKLFGLDEKSKHASSTGAVRFCRQLLLNEHVTNLAISLLLVY